MCRLPIYKSQKFEIRCKFHKPIYNYQNSLVILKFVADFLYNENTTDMNRLEFKMPREKC